MGKITGFLEFGRKKQPYRSVSQRIRDWDQVMLPWPSSSLQEQASRCMDCGIPFCHQACPLGNLIPDWNDLVYRGQWHQAVQRLHATNNFPEFTGTLCPAPCEGACVLDINSDPVTIKAVELAIADRAWDEGWVPTQKATSRTHKRVAVVGSGPAGLAAAQQLVRAGHEVMVFERSDRIGGLLRYGIPEFKMEKKVLDRRLSQLSAEGVLFTTNAHVGQDIPVADLRDQFDALLLTAGACQARDLPIDGHTLRGVHQAMDYLTMQNRLCEGDAKADGFIDAQGKNVVIIGGGDTGADCLGTANRQGARAVSQFEIMPRPPLRRAADNPWPEWPQIFRVTPAHEEGVERVYSVKTERFLGDADGNVRGLAFTQLALSETEQGVVFQEIPDGQQELSCELVILAMGFLGPERHGMIEQLGVRLDARGNICVDPQTWMTSVEGVFAAGDMHRGQSLIVWAIAEGRSAAAGIDRYLMGETNLPAPL